MEPSLATCQIPLGSAVADQFLGLQPHPTKCQATYIWINGSVLSLQCKTRTLDAAPLNITDYPIWNYNRNPSGQGEYTYLKAVAHYPDPFLGGQNKLVMCETFDKNMKPTDTNQRASASSIMEQLAKYFPWFGMEQEYVLMDRNFCVLGSIRYGRDSKASHYGVGTHVVVGREIMQAHYRACLHAGLKIYSTKAGRFTGQWSFTIGTCEGISLGDEMWMARFLLHRVAEQFGVVVSFYPEHKDEFENKCHVTFSISCMREQEGIKYFDTLVNRLEKKHQEHLKMYDPRSESHRRQHLSYFTSGVGYNCSVRIPPHVTKEGKGYIEDRRPSSICDPYIVTRMIAQTYLL